MQMFKVTHNQMARFYWLLPLFIFFLPASNAQEVQAVSELKDSISSIFSQAIPQTEIGFDMVLISGGTFAMGSLDTETHHRIDETPLHEVDLDSFYMAEYELTWGLFELFFKQNKKIFVNLNDERVMKIDAISRPSPQYEDPSYGMGKVGFPAVSMSTYSALVFCKWLSTVTGRFYRLPTEAEWEYAARAGSKTAYSFGDGLEEIDDYAVYYKNSDSH